MDEPLDEINVAETDVIIYEFAMDRRPTFAFTPYTTSMQKVKSKRNKKINELVEDH